MNYYALGASFLGTGVEFVEALTIVLAIAAVRGWKNALLGAFSAVVVLAAVILVVGVPLTQIIQLSWLQLAIGLIMLLFGIRWLRKAILRYAGLKALHNEEESYYKEVERARKAGQTNQRFDKFAFGATFSGTFLEGLEAIFIVITLGLSSHAMTSTMVGAALATVAVIVAGVLLRKPLAKIPENTMKFIVGVMLTSFGSFWFGESLGVQWPQEDISIVYLIATLLLVSWLLVIHCRRILLSNTVGEDLATGVGTGVRK